MKRPGLSRRPTFRANYLTPALSDGLIVYTIPERPRSRLQKYRLTPQGRSHLATSCAKHLLSVVSVGG